VGIAESTGGWALARVTSPVEIKSRNVTTETAASSRDNVMFRVLAISTNLLFDFKALPIVVPSSPLAAKVSCFSSQSAS
jgi:hypothetical protein